MYAPPIPLSLDVSALNQYSLRTSPQPGLLSDQGYGRGGTPIFTDVFEPLARVALYPTDEDGLITCFGAA